MENFLSRIEEGYSRHKNPYHNNLHGADVAQTVHYMLCQTGLMVINNRTVNYTLNLDSNKLVVVCITNSTQTYDFSLGFNYHSNKL